MPSEIGITVDFSGLDRLLQAVPERVERFLDWEAESIVTDIKLSFVASPSPEGGPPGVDTGALRASITWEKTGNFERTVSDGVEYGIWLEDGVEQNNLGARPWMAPAFGRAQERMESDAKEQLGLEEI